MTTRPELAKATPFWAELEELGEEEVKLMLNSLNRWGAPELKTKERSLVEHWLQNKKDQRALDASAKRDAREEDTLLIAREANRIASRAERWAMYAAIAAVIALIISIVISQK